MRKRQTLLFISMLTTALSPAVVLCATTSAQSEARIAHPQVPRIAAESLKQLLDQKADVVIVDTQDPEGYALWHIPTAVNIPYSPSENPADREMRLSALPMEKLVVIYCLCEEGADSGAMALELRKLGFSAAKVKVLAGGLIKWDERGYPMVKDESAP
jgi:rhodanese-related sulfurtransferase